MKQNELIKKTFEYSRLGFEKAFEAAETVHGKTEEFTGKALEQATLVPEQGKELVRKWIEEGRRVRREIKEAVLKGHEKFEGLLFTA
jgi:hypothetical protein